MSDILKTVTDTIAQKPEVGIFSSMAGVALSPLEMISLLSAFLGLILAALTLSIKIIEIFERMADRKLHIKRVRADQIRDGDGNTVLYVKGKRYIIAPDDDEVIVSEDPPEDT